MKYDCEIRRIANSRRDHRGAGIERNEPKERGDASRRATRGAAILMRQERAEAGSLILS